MTDDKTINELKNSEEQFRKMIEYANDAIFTVDPQDGTILYANIKAEHFCQNDKECIIGLKVWDLHPEQEHASIKKMFEKVVDSGEGSHSELNLIRKDGTTIIVDVSSSMITYGDKKVIQRICHDITGRKKLENHNQELMESFKYILDMMPVGFGVRTKTGKESIVEFENSKLKEMFHPEGDDHDHEHDHWNIVGGDEDTEPKIIIDDNGVYIEEHNLEDGRIFQFTINYIKDFNDTWRELQIVRDVTKRRKLEKDLILAKENLEQKVLERTKELREKQTQLIQSEKMAALGNLVAGVAHEINTPMGALKSNYDLFSRYIKKIKDSISVDMNEKDNKVFNHFDSIDQLNDVNKTASERIIKIVNSLRNFARLDQAEKDKIDIHDGLESTLTLIHHKLKNNIEIVKEYKLTSKVNCYPNQINQVFMNVLVNASQAIDTDGIIHIVTYQKENEAVIEISDSGKGISPENLKKIFDPGFTTKGVGVGTGLGLSIVHNIVENHNGHIEVDSKQGKGSTFKIYLPLV